MKAPELITTATDMLPMLVMMGLAHGVIAVVRNDIKNFKADFASKLKFFDHRLSQFERSKN